MLFDIGTHIVSKLKYTQYTQEDRLGTRTPTRPPGDCVDRTSVKITIRITLLLQNRGLENNNRDFRINRKLFVKLVVSTKNVESSVKFPTKIITEVSHRET